MGAQALREPLHDGLTEAERPRQRMRLGAAVAGEQRRGRAAVEHERAQPVAVARGVGERDARAVACRVQLDVPDAELVAHGIQIGRRSARAVGVAAVADAAREPAAARVDEHDVAAVAQRIEQRQQRGPIGRGGNAVAAGADEHGVARLGAAAVGVELEADANGSGRGVGRDQRNRHRAAARAVTRAGAQVRGRCRRRERARGGQSDDRDPRARRGYQRSPQPAQLGSQRCSNEMCGAPVSSARRKDR